MIWVDFSGPKHQLIIRQTSMACNTSVFWITSVMKSSAPVKLDPARAWLFFLREPYASQPGYGTFHSTLRPFVESVTHV